MISQFLEGVKTESLDMGNAPTVKEQIERARSEGAEQAIRPYETELISSQR
jgi:hypothetical protein